MQAIPRRVCRPPGWRSPHATARSLKSRAAALRVRPRTFTPISISTLPSLGSPTSPPTIISPASIRAMSSNASRALNLANINPHVKAAKYAVRGEIPIKAEEYRSALALGHGKDLPFDTVIAANIGNPQQLDQKPITFFRQVASLLENPALLEHEDVLLNQLGYQSDVLARARRLLREVQSVGAYSLSMGAPGIRASVAKFIERRDGYPADPSTIYLSTGASSGVNTLLHVICATPETGVLIPIPQYPLYTATLAVLNARCVPYYLDEAKAWGTNLDSIRDALTKARADGTDVRAIAVINPGNPTGGTLTAAEVQDVLRFAAEEKLVVIADEVYQTNVFVGEFTSFKKSLSELQAANPGIYDTVELASLHSISKGMVGECGHRGGYFELVGFDPEVVAQIYKFVSIQLCPPVVGQCIVECMVNPPREGEPSYPLYKQEYDSIFEGLHKRALALYEAFKRMEGVHCQEPQGSMYLYPTITLPSRAHEAAAAENHTPDEFYCLRLLDATGICVVPGSGFGQKEGTLHFRTTFLAPGTDWVERMVSFHEGFMAEWK
ncbi:alanine aminotransferas-like protein [Trichodelitschia bisporula]|uniref:Glutamate pyruvate transaminase n=1 Tax=Trichodelitschia bisporula TaxID=703511 RepID=A0A6G1HSG5_9PEZI|nr:alanine aminotransferas-like protein [Trichodelitschia bisporula]